MNKEFKRMQKLAGIITESTGPVYVPGSNPDIDDKSAGMALDMMTKEGISGKMSKGEAKKKIKEAILAELETTAGINAYDEVDNLDEAKKKEGGLTPLQQYVYNYEIDVSGEEEAKQFLEDIKQLKTPKDVYEYYAYDRDWADSMEDDLNNLYKRVSRKFKNISEAKKKEGEPATDTSDDVDDLDLDLDTIDTDDSTKIDMNMDTNTDIDAGSSESKKAFSELTDAYRAAKELGDEKLIRQIANTITYFNKNIILNQG